MDRLLLFKDAGLEGTGALSNTSFTCQGMTVFPDSFSDETF